MKHPKKNFFYIYSIFYLHETKQIINIPNFICFNSNRDQSRSGGVCLGIHRSIENDVKLLTTNDSDITAIRITGKTLSLDIDIILINVYDSDERSSYKKNKIMDSDHASTLENLASDDDCEICFAGDLNARTGGLNFIPEHNDWEDKTKQSECKIQRSSRDSIINTRGHKLLDFISSCNLNGCTLRDVFGEFTCMRYNGISVVDYMATSPRLRNTVQSFEVGELTKSLSDPRPITCTFNIKSNIVNAHDLLVKHDNAPLKLNIN